MNAFVMKPLIGGKELTFLDRQESRFPNLARLCMDFSFRVFETLHLDIGAPSKSVLLVSNDYRSIETGAITPCFKTLNELEEYVESNMIDILHDYLFGFVEDDIQLSKQA